ncbi:MAG: serine protease [Candidatus Moranbacteria bacterium]|nr:serine protease [Candidatus Moranbacteria bacterium]
MKTKIYSKKQFVFLILFSTLVFSATTPFTANAVEPPPFCTSYTYSDWSSCDPNSGTQERINISNFPSDCIIDFSGNNPAPITRQRCIPECISSSWSCGNWNTCSSFGLQTRTCTGVANCQGGVSSPATSQSCVYIAPVPSCTSYTYSDWSSCSSGGNQTRSVISSSPSGCIGGSPALSRSCYYVKPVESLDSCAADTWACGDWDSCSLSGVQSRSCRKTVDCPNVDTITPVSTRYCESSSRPAQEVPQDSGAISNQDTIIKATVKLICPLDKNRAFQGSGTVISSSGLILTNKHVVSGTLGCLVEFIDNANDTPYFGNRQIADIQKVSSKEDVATLKLRNPQNKKLTYIDITKANSNLRLGSKVHVYGYPAIFGTNMTYTSGDFGGVDGSYLKTGVVLEHGNSGGGAYLSNGVFIGIPTLVRRGELNALSYILSINTINAWLGNSSVAYSGNSNQNNYSRVSSVLEDIDLKELGSLEFIIPGTKESEDIANEPSDVIEEDQPPISGTNDEPTKNPPVETNTNESWPNPFVVLVFIILGGGFVWIIWKSMKNNIEKL